VEWHGAALPLKEQLRAAAIAVAKLCQ